MRQPIGVSIKGNYFMTFAGQHQRGEMSDWSGPNDGAATWSRIPQPLQLPDTFQDYRKRLAEAVLPKTDRFWQSINKSCGSDDVFGVSTATSNDAQRGARHASDCIPPPAGFTC